MDSLDVKKLNGIAVVSIAAGEKLGEVEDVMLDADQRRVGALKVESGGLLRHEHRFVPFSAIQSFGVDAVMIPDAAVLQPTQGAQAAGYHAASDLDHLRVVTESGVFLGNVSTARFDPASGAITDFEVGTGGLGGLLGKNTSVSATSVTSIGGDIMVVPNSVGEQADAS